jgi:predicted ArsR family transcriptional regulator
MKAGKSMQELSEWDQLRTFIDHRLIKALGHPVREHLLAVLNERIASASEIGDEIGADVSSFYHHVEELEKLGCIERVATKKRRGAKEHFFRATKTLSFDDDAWRQLPLSLRADLTDGMLQLLFDDVMGALAADTFDARDDRHVSWMPTVLDERGWDEATELLRQTLDGLLAIHGESAKRLAQGDGVGIHASFALLAFETPQRG